LIDSFVFLFGGRSALTQKEGKEGTANCKTTVKGEFRFYS